MNGAAAAALPLQVAAAAALPMLAKIGESTYCWKDAPRVGGRDMEAGAVPALAGLKAAMLTSQLPPAPKRCKKAAAPRAGRREQALEVGLAERTAVRCS